MTVQLCALHGQAVEVVAEAVRVHGVTNLVVDPVLVATSGDSLAADGVAQALLTRCATNLYKSILLSY